MTLSLRFMLISPRGFQMAYALATAALMSCSAVTKDSGAPEPLGTSHADVQTAYLKHFSVAVGLTGAAAEAQRATGTVLVPIRDNNNKVMTAADGVTEVRGTCGVTFITPLHAVTAAHCVPDTDIADPPNQPVSVQMYRLSPTVPWQNATALTGSFPQYTHPRLTEADGYVVDTLSCRVAVRCGFGSYNCDPNQTSDLALLRCDQALDPLYYGFLPVAASDSETGPVSVFWSHELYDLPTTLPASDASEPLVDFWNHYTKYPTNGAYGDNLHYWGGEKNQIFPLVSNEWLVDGVLIPRTRLGREGRVVWTDLFGCHGTSGAGVMQLNTTTNRYELLGPVVIGNWQVWGTPHRLCMDAEIHQPGVRGVAYLNLAYVQSVAAIAAAEQAQTAVEPVVVPPVEELAP